MKKIKEKHIERLIKGQKSGINIGSRQVPHDLYQHEQTAFNLAVKYGFLTLKEDSRKNLLDVWEKYCLAQKRPMLILKKFNNGTAEVWEDSKVQRFCDAKTAVQRLKFIAVVI